MWRAPIPRQGDSEPSQPGDPAPGAGPSPCRGERGQVPAEPWRSQRTDIWPARTAGRHWVGEGPTVPSSGSCMIPRLWAVSPMSAFDGLGRVLPRWERLRND